MINNHATIRRATNLDLDRIVACDPIAATDPRRAAFIAARVGDGECCVYESGHDILGFIILEYTFYEHGFVSLLCVREGARRHGVGRALMHHSLLSGSTRKLFTSTNQSNGPMRALLAACGFEPSGVIYNLDVGDPLDATAWQAIADQRGTALVAA